MKSLISTTCRRRRKEAESGLSTKTIFGFSVNRVTTWCAHPLRKTMTPRTTRCPHYDRSKQGGRGPGLPMNRQVARLSKVEFAVTGRCSSTLESRATFMAPMCVQHWRSRLSMNRFRRGTIAELINSAMVLASGSWPQCASKIWRSKLSTNLSMVTVSQTFLSASLLPQGGRQECLPHGFVPRTGEHGMNASNVGGASAPRLRRQMSLFKNRGCGERRQNAMPHLRKCGIRSPRLPLPHGWVLQEPQMTLLPVGALRPLPHSAAVTR